MSEKTIMKKINRTKQYEGTVKSVEVEEVKKEYVGYFQPLILTLKTKEEDVVFKMKVYDDRDVKKVSKLLNQHVIVRAKLNRIDKTIATFDIFEFFNSIPESK